jgi:anaerobic selenocysteine-containing dehydrogenase
MGSDALNRPLRVADFIATRSGDEDRGPMVVMNPDDARSRLLTDGELAWVYGPRRHELATVHIDPGMRLGDVAVRDIVGVAPSEVVRVVKPDLDSRGRRPLTDFA